MTKRFLIYFLLFSSALFFAQETQEINPQLANGSFVDEVQIIIIENNAEIVVDEKQMEDFYKAFFIKPGTTFNGVITDVAINRIKEQKNVSAAYYKLYESPTGVGKGVELKIYVTVSESDLDKTLEKGILTKNGGKDFPLVYESDKAQIKLFLNGGVGCYNDVNALFGKGKEFTQGNPVADQPAEEGTRFWGEAFVEPGISAISKLGKSNIYAYGEASAVLSGRNSADIYSSGSTAYLAFERLYGGLLATGLGKNKDITINANYGRNYFQLNDGWLFSRLSGSSNAGDRGGVYSSPRSTFQKNGNLSIHWKEFSLSGHFIEPQELFKDKQINANYMIATFNFNNNKNLDAGISYIQTSGGKARYGLPDGTIQKKGMYVINPKLWLSNIAETGLFLKTEFAYQGHHQEDMKSLAWYTGLGYSFKNVKSTPSIYYRYSFMKGDDDQTETYERFDPMLTGGLGNWVQGLNFRKVLGNGNLISHRIEATSWLSKSMALSFDYFYLQSDQLNNIGGLPPITDLKNNDLGHEFSLTLKGLIQKNITLLGIVSYTLPGKGLKTAFPDSTPNWLTVQAALFFNY